MLCEFYDHVSAHVVTGQRLTVAPDLHRRTLPASDVARLLAYLLRKLLERMVRMAVLVERAHILLPSMPSCCTRHTTECDPHHPARNVPARPP